MIPRYKLSKDRQSLKLGLVDDLIDSRHYIRLLDEFVESMVSSDEQGYTIKGKHAIGQRPYGARTMLKLYLYGYLNRISSSRMLENETKRNIEMIWLLGGLSPDFKTIADYRRDHGMVIKKALKQFNKFLKHESYIKGEGVSIDGTKIKANTNRDTLSIEKINKKLHRLTSKLDTYVKQLSYNDEVEKQEQDLAELALQQRKALARISNLHQEIEELEQKRKYINGVEKNHVNFTDVDASLIKGRDGSMPQYNGQSVVCQENKMLMLLEATEDVNDTNQLEPMVEQTNLEYGDYPEKCRTDTGYYKTTALQRVEQKGIDSYCAIPRTTQRKVVLDENGQAIEFIYEEQKDEYKCSKGQLLKRLPYKIKKQQRSAAQYQGINCGSCPIKNKCTQSKKGRIVYRYDDQEWVEDYRKKMNSPKGRFELKQRMCEVEHPFGTIKLWMGKIPLKLRGKAKVQSELDLYQMTYNFKRLTNIAEFEVILCQIRKYDWKNAA